MIKSLFHKFLIYRRSLIYRRELRTRLKTMPKAALTQDEIKAIRKVYAPLHLAYDLQWFQYYKFYRGVADPYFIPRDIWKTMELSLNPKEYRFIQCKATLHRFIDKQYLPVTIVNKFYGFIYDADDNIITKEQAVNLLLQHNEFVFKPTDHTGGGRGVKLVELNTLSDKKAYLEQMLDGDFFICQEVLHPSKRITRFNNGDKTVNTVRCFTLLLNGQVHVISGFMRMGGGQTFNDNVCSKTSANLDPKTANCYVGIKQNGRLNEFGLYDIDLFHKYDYSPSGLLLRNEKLDFWEDVKQLTMSLHKKLPMLGFIAWDVTIDENNHLKVVEINLDSQDVDDHHIFNGAVFKDYFNDLVEYTLTHPVIYA